MKPVRVGPDYGKWPTVLELIQNAFAYMDDLLGRPSSAHELTCEILARNAVEGTAFVIEEQGRPVACVFSRPSRDWPDAYYFGKLAVDSDFRGKGLAKALILAVAVEAKRLGFNSLTLDTGAALSETRTAFARMGFRLEQSKAAASRPDPGIVTMSKHLN